MPIIVSCPQCSGQLRVADDLIGRKVRCPACNGTFAATQTAAAPPVEPSPTPRQESLDLPIETQRLDPWQHLNLELTSEPQETPAAPQPQPTGLVGATEIESSGPAVPSRPVPPREEKKRKQDIRQQEAEDQEVLCPECGHANAPRDRWCYVCDAALNGEEDEDHKRPLGWRRRRRDCEPHRGGFVLTMGISSLVAVSLSVMCYIAAPVIGLVGVALGLTAWILGQKDLPRMKDGTMDLDGYNSTQGGWICGIIGTCLNALIVLTCGGFLGAIWYSSYTQSRNVNPPVINAPPPPAPMPPQMPKN